MTEMKSYIGGLYGVHISDINLPYCQQDLPDVIHMQPTVEDVLNKLDKDIIELRRKIVLTWTVGISVTILNLSLLVYQIYNIFVK